MSSATLRKILSYVLPWTAVLMLVYEPAFNFVFRTIMMVPVLFSFPIPGKANEWGEHFPLSESARIWLSLICDQFMLAMFATIPLYRTKRFEDSTFYSAYKMFWWFNAPIFSIILIMVLGWTFSSLSAATFMEIIGLIFNFIFIAIPPAIILTLTLTPAYFQHKSKHDKP